jgi:hypothetical protein
MTRSLVPVLNRTALFALILFTASCALIGGFSARSHEHVTSLKAAHMKFIDTFTAAPEASWDRGRFMTESDKIDLKFREALEFSTSLNDDLRTANITILNEIFVEDEALIRNKDRLLTQIEADTLKGPSAQAYDRVIAGECARPGASCK